MSVDKNLQFVIDKVGGTPAILIEGPVSTGKSTQTKIKCALYGTNASKSITNLYAWSSSSLVSIRDLLPNISMNIDDIDYDKSYQPTNTQSFWMTQCATGIDMTQSNGIREGSSAIFTAICNNADNCVDFESKAVLSRVELLKWENYIDTLTVAERKETLQKLHEFLDA
eukprot:16707_1